MQRKGDLLLQEAGSKRRFTANVLARARLCTRTKLIWIVICVNSAHQLEPRLRRASLCAAALITLRLTQEPQSPLSRVSASTHTRIQAIWGSFHAAENTFERKFAEMNLSRARTRKFLLRRDERKPFHFSRVQSRKRERLTVRIWREAPFVTCTLPAFSVPPSARDVFLAGAPCLESLDDLRLDGLQRNRIFSFRAGSEDS